MKDLRSKDFGSTGRLIVVVLVSALVSLSVFAEWGLAASTILTKGSTTVLPIAQRTAEVYMEKHPDANISVQGGGSGVGIAAFIDGTCDIANASRPMKQEELDLAITKGRDPRAHTIGMDGMAVIVHPSNSISGITKEQIKAIYTGKISEWSAVGGSAGRIVVLSRDSASGTFEAFGELALDKAKVRADALMQASNQAIATTVEKTPGAIGYVGLGFISSKVKAMSVSGVMASRETVLSGKYSLSRPLFMYTDGEPKGEVKSYLDFIVSPEGQALVEEIGYVGLK